MVDVFCHTSLAVLLGASDRMKGVLFLLLIWVIGATWWMVQKRRQSWWWGYSQRPADNTGERWRRINEARADKPMPERRVSVARESKRRR